MSRCSSPAQTVWGVLPACQLIDEALMVRSPVTRPPPAGLRDTPILLVRLRACGHMILPLSLILRPLMIIAGKPEMDTPPWSGPVVCHVPSTLAAAATKRREIRWCVVIGHELGLRICFYVPRATRLIGIRMTSLRASPEEICPSASLAEGSDGDDLQSLPRSQSKYKWHALKRHQRHELPTARPVSPRHCVCEIRYGSLGGTPTLPVRSFCRC